MGGIWPQTRKSLAKSRKHSSVAQEMADRIRLFPFLIIKNSVLKSYRRRVLSRHTVCKARSLRNHNPNKEIA
jgi:hypothetical protein